MYLSFLFHNELSYKILIAIERIKLKAIYFYVIENPANMFYKRNLRISAKLLPEINIDAFKAELKENV